MSIESAIPQLAAIYNFAWDRLDPKAVSACFVEDGVFVDASGEAHRGRGEIEAFVERSPEIFGRKMRHLTMSHVLNSVDETTVHHMCYLLFAAWPNNGERMLTTGTYEDTLTLTFDGWRFAKRIVTLD